MSPSQESHRAVATAAWRPSICGRRALRSRRGERAAGARRASHASPRRRRDRRQGSRDSHNAQGIGGFVNGARALITPALVMVAAIAPLALIAGGLVLLFGGRRGMQIIGTSLGVLLLLGSVTSTNQLGTDASAAAHVAKRPAARRPGPRRRGVSGALRGRAGLLVAGLVVLVAILLVSSVAAPQAQAKGILGTGISIPNPLSPILGGLSSGIVGLAVKAFEAIIKALFTPLAKFVTVALIGWLTAIPNFAQGHVGWPRTPSWAS